MQAASTSTSRVHPALLTFSVLLLLTVAAVFLFSGISKLVAMEPFTWTFMDLGISHFKAASIAAHLFIGLELMTGLFLLAHLYLRSFTYPFTIALLAALSVYLVYVLATEGNRGDCGCFGNWLSMSPLWALLKNIGMIAAVLFLRRFHSIPPYKNQELLAMALGMATLVGPFLKEPLSSKDESIDLAPLYASSPAPSVDLRQRRQVLAFMSLTCPHCREAAKKFRELRATDPSLPIFMVLNGLPEQEAGFFEETGAQEVPHLLFRNKEAFRKMAGPYVPSIYYVGNSVIKRKVSYPELSALSIRQWAK